MSRTLLLVDVPNIFDGIRSKWPEHNLDYDKVIQMYEGCGFQILHKVAFCSPGKGRNSLFYDVLKKLGFSFDDFNPASMALTIAESLGCFDSLIVGTNNPCIIPILQYARRKGIFTYTFGVNVHAHIERFSEVHELDESTNKPRPQATEQVDMSTDHSRTIGGSVG